jgi:hypothetical protein
VDDSSFNIRVPRSWARVSLIVVVTALIVAPLTALASHTFKDVSDSNTFHTDIDWLAGAGITKGCNPPTNDEFCPNDSVSRGQMSAFMRRFAQYIDAEDGTPAQADNATTLDGYGMPNFLGANVTTRLAELPGPNGGNASAVATCEAGEVLIGGGGALSAFVADVFLLSSRPIPDADDSTPTSWQASATNPPAGTASIDVRAWAVCASFPDTPLASVAESRGVDTPEPGRP